ncbi:MAG TPA: Wzz/FepE/Etk N-terminal domain-containing protein [Candidatus Acidoferrales bacterium]|nr:Wzz/FepE/Etk N-terminal domain-containing protein [Candidatus Acidoferrales bacterium]
MVDDFQEGKTKSFEEYWEIVRRRRWLIAGAIFVCWSVVWGIGWLLPQTYESEAEILVEQQQVPADYVTPNVSTTPEQQLQTMTQQVLSRTRLQNIIDQYHLYSHQNPLVAMFESSDHVEQMRKDIKIDLVVTPDKNQRQQLTGFKISYGAGSPEIANAIVAQLANFFISQNMITQQQQSQSTTSFLSTQLADAKAKLDQQEAQVRAFKVQHMGELPDQLQSNVQILSGLQSEWQNVQGALDRSQQQKLYLESLIQQYETAQANLDSAGGDSAISPPALDKELKDLRMQLAQERAQYTDNYPDVIALKDQIAKTEALKKQIDTEIAKNQKTGKPGDALNSATAADVQNGHPTPMMQIQSQLKANQLQIESEKKAAQDLQARIVRYQNRLNMAPMAEQQLAEVSRGYNEAKANYDSLLANEQKSQLATNLEQNQQGERFSLVDPASLPAKPSSPNHVLISLGGLAFGLVVGLALTILLELTGERIRQEKDLEGIVPARVLVGIPHISTPQEHQQRMARRWLERGVAIAIVLLIVAGNIYAFYKG